MPRSLPTWLLALVAVGGVAGCSAKLPEGVFGCMMSSECPAGWYCWSNMTCHSTPERDGGPDTGLPPLDGGGLRDPMCVPACSMGMCAVGQFGGTMPSPGCIANPAPLNHGNTCANGSQCTSPDTCIPMMGGRCLRPCDPANFTNGGCGFSEDCVTYVGAPVCLRPCTGTGPGACPTPLTCSSGHCVPM